MNSTFKNRAFTFLAALVLSVPLAAACFAQDAPAPPDGNGPQPPGRPERFRDRRGPGPDGLHVGPPGRWWDNPDFAQKLSLSTDQQKKMDDIFSASRLKLIDASAALEKEEAIMEPLVNADPSDDGKILTQIDRVAQARAELEKTRARMLLDLRRQLSHDQWVKLQDMRPPMGGHRHRGGPPSGDEAPAPPPQN